MTLSVVLPIKRFAAAKQRLGDVELRERLAPAMVADVLHALAGNDVIVVSGEPALAATIEKLGFTAVDDPDEGHSAAAARGIEIAVQRGATSVALLAGDCPLLDVADLYAAAGVVVFADRHGTGTNGLLLSPPDAIAPAFGEGSRGRHEALASAAGVPCAVRLDSSIAIDADTPDDLDAMRCALRGDPLIAPRTRAVLL